MPTFKIMTPVPNYTGAVGENPPTRFVDGSAELDVIDHTSAARLAYFRSAGYRIEAPEGVSVDDAIRRVTLTPDQEYAELEREKRTLERESELDSLRREVERKRAERDKATEVDQVVSAPVEVVVAPDANAPVGEWRDYGVKRLGIPASEVKAWDKPSLQKREQERAAAAEFEGGDAR